MPSAGTISSAPLQLLTFPDHLYCALSFCSFFNSRIMSSTATYLETTPAAPAKDATSILNRADGTSTSESRSRYHIPWPATKEAQRKWQLEQMAGAFRIFAKLGFADGASGHISLRGQ